MVVSFFQRFFLFLLALDKVDILFPVQALIVGKQLYQAAVMFTQGFPLYRFLLDLATVPVAGDGFSLCFPILTRSSHDARYADGRLSRAARLQT